MYVFTHLKSAGKQILMSFVYFSFLSLNRSHSKINTKTKCDKKSEERKKSVHKFIAIQNVGKRAEKKADAGSKDIN